MRSASGIGGTIRGSGKGGFAALNTTVKCGQAYRERL